MVTIGIEADGEPDFYPDHLDLPAPPPPGTVIDVGGRELTVKRLLIKVNVLPHDGGGEVVTSRYVAEIEESR